MALRTDVEGSAAQGSSVTSGSGPEDSTGPEGSSRTPDTGESGFKTIQILKEWPVIKSTVNKTQNFYESLRRKNRIFSWSCSLAEKSVAVLSDRSSTFLPVVYPALQIADLAASYVAEELQRKLPALRQSPQQVSVAVRSAVSNLVAPLVERIVFPVTNGKRWAQSAANNVGQICGKLIECFDKWFTRVEENTFSLKHEEIKARRQQRAPATSPPRVYHRCSSPALGPSLRWLQPGPPRGPAAERVSVCCPDCLDSILEQQRSSYVSYKVTPAASGQGRPSSVFITAAGAAESADQQRGNVPVLELKAIKDQ